MRQEPQNGIVADGRDRLLEACEDEIRKIEADVRALHAHELVNAGLIERLRIEAKIRSEIRTAVDRIAPPDTEACY